MALKDIVVCALLTAIILSFVISSATVNFNDSMINNGWGCFNIIFYILAVLPLIPLKILGPDAASDHGAFLSVGAILSSFAFPIILTKRNIIEVQTFMHK